MLVSVSTYIDGFCHQAVCDTDLVVLLQNLDGLTGLLSLLRELLDPVLIDGILSEDKGEFRSVLVIQFLSGAEIFFRILHGQVLPFELLLQTDALLVSLREHLLDLALLQPLTFRGE